MPGAVDPMSASSRPMIPFDSLPSRPLPFGATPDMLQPINVNTSHLTSASSKLPKPRLAKESLPREFPAPAYSHSRHASNVSIHSTIADLNLNGRAERDLELGSDEWMSMQVAKCVDSAAGTLDLRNLGLIQLSTKISDLRDLVTLPSSFSPFSLSSRRPFASPSSPLDSYHLSPGQQPYAASPDSGNGGRFSRVNSAPVHDASRLLNRIQDQNRPFERAPSALATPGALLVSPALLEMAESASSTAAAPAASSFRGTRQASFARSKTGAVQMGSRGGKFPAKDLCIIASGNLLRSLPTALFEIPNLTVLTLRNNKLTSLPAAIGGLVNLKELNIGNNQIEVLPSTILNLSLSVFLVHPNPFRQIPTESQTTLSSPTDADSRRETTAGVATCSSGRILSPLVRHDPSPVPRLHALTLNNLISPRPPSSLPPLLDHYAWETPAKGETHPLLDSSVLHTIIPQICEKDLRRVLQALRSASYHFRHSKTDFPRGSSSPGLGSSTKIDPLPRSHRTPAPDDGSLNPYYNPCPSPRHLEYDPASSAVRPSRHLFLHPAEERIEWREVFGESSLPIQWVGCSPGCLAFLEHDEEDDWSLSEE